MIKAIVFFCLICWVVGIVYFGFHHLYDKKDQMMKILKVALLSFFIILVGLIVTYFFTEIF
jgi:hypothetical protein